MSDSSSYALFTQRNGLAEIPPQLKLGELSQDFRTLIVYAFKKEIEAHSEYRRFTYEWMGVARDFQVKHLKFDPDIATSDPEEFYLLVRNIFDSSEYGEVFDAIEFLKRHRSCSDGFKHSLMEAFHEGRLAYRLMPTGIVVAIGNEAQANAVLLALRTTEDVSAVGARQHLLNAGVALRNADWAGSVRESIHAVEATAKLFAPSGKTLGDALSVLEREQNLHGALKKAFSQLYGYTNDEKGVRHANVLEDHPNVGEAEALFMLGACASFVSYLLTKMSEKDQPSPN